MRMLPALAFLPPAEVPDAFDGLLEVFPTEATDLAMYFEDTYIGRRRRNGVQAAMFSTSLWSVHDAVLQNLPRTNNSVEAWHRGFQVSGLVSKAISSLFIAAGMISKCLN